MDLSKNQNLNLVGLNYKDKEINAKKFIFELGNPYNFILTDTQGIISIELGAYGVPETFLINNKKIVLLKIIGALNNKGYKEIIDTINNEK